MTRDVIIIVLIAFLYYAYAFYLWRILISYKRALKNWRYVDAKVVETVAYPRSYGIVPIIEYSVNNEWIKTEVKKCYFSKYSTFEKVDIVYDPDNIKECFIISRTQIIKNIILLIFINFVCIGAELFFINKLI